MSAPVFVVNVGFDSRGRARNRLFSCEHEARAFVERVYCRTGRVLSIIRRAAL